MKRGFTLAEVLITLGIIGIVAALTIPALISRYKEKQTVTRLKKVYSMLAQAYTVASFENGDPVNWGFMADPGNSTSSANFEGNQNWFKVQFEPYFKVIKNCENNAKGCFSNSTIKKLNGSNWQTWSADEAKHYYRFVTADGVLYAIKTSSPDCTKDWGDGAFKQGCGHVIVDIDGVKNGNNTFGKDLFMFVLTKKGYFPAGTVDHLAGASFSATIVNESAYTTAWVIYNENMDYLYCDDLEWNKKTKCK